MSNTTRTDQTEMRYLLGDLSEDENTRMEEAFFADDSKFELLECAEDELVDSYVRNTLAPDKHQQFQAKLRTSPRLLERVNFARTLADKVDVFPTPAVVPLLEPVRPINSSPVKPKTRWWRFAGPQPAWGIALAACVLIMVIGGGLLVFELLHLRNESQRLASEVEVLQRQKSDLDKRSHEEGTRAEHLAAELELAHEQQANDQKLIEEQETKLRETQAGGLSLSALATVFLTPGSLRSGGGAQSVLVLRPETARAEVKIALLENEYRTYIVELKTVDEDRLIKRATGLRPHSTSSGEQLLLSLPARQLPAADYKVHVDGVTASGQIKGVDDYQFQVVSRPK